MEIPLALKEALASFTNEEAEKVFEFLSANPNAAQDMIGFLGLTHSEIEMGLELS